MVGTKQIVDYLMTSDNAEVGGMIISNVTVLVLVLQ